MSGPRTPSRGTANLNSPSKGSTPTHISQLLTIRPPISQAVSAKTVRRVTLHPSIYNLLSLSVTSPQHNNLVEIKVDDSPSSVIAVAWSGSQGGDPKCVQIPPSVVEDLKALAQDVSVNLDFSEKSKSRVEVKKYLGSIGYVGTVEVEDYLQQVPSGDSDGWKYYLEHYLLDVRYMSEGMVFTCDYKGSSVSLRVKTVTPGERATTPYGNPTNGSGLEGRLGGLSLKEPRVYEFDKSSVAIFKGLQDGPAPSTPQPKAAPMTPRKSMAATKASIPQVPREVKSFPATRSSSIGGLDRQLEILRTHIASSLLHFRRFTRSNLTPPLGILLYGPPGTGKTMLLRSIATEAGANNYIIDSSLIGKFLGESEASIRKVFAEAKKPTDGKKRSIIFIDEIDAFAPKRGGTDTTSDSRLVTTLLTEMDALAAIGEDTEEESSRVMVVAATNRPNGIDPALRRPGRFDLEIEIPIPDAKSRLEILKILLKDVETEFDKSIEGGHITIWANRAHGFVGADLETVVKKAATRSVHRSLKPKDGESSFPGFFLDEVDTSEGALTISADDFETALKETKPSAIKDIVLELPETKWNDIGGQQDVKQKLKEAVEWPLRHPEVFHRLGGQPRKGLLLYGPPGCSKTLTAKALATEAGLNFIAVKGPELLNKYVGESERAVRELFRKARAASPSIVFFDEVDALGLNREGEGNHGGGNSTGVLTALLNEMDGIEELGNVMILAATNKPEVIDPALLRPGRLDYILYVGPPDLAARIEILNIKAKKMKLDEDVDIQRLAEKTDGYSGADLVKICDEAVLAAMREDLEIDSVKWRHFEEALRGVKSVITMEMVRRYETWNVGGVKKV